MLSRIYKIIIPLSIFIMIGWFIYLSSGISLADGLSSAEITALSQYPDWVGLNCATGLSSLPNGDGLADGAIFPNLKPAAMGQAINKWITTNFPSSPFGTKGSEIVIDAQSQNINPFLIVALMVNESGAGSTTKPNSSWILANNAFGRKAGQGQPGFGDAKISPWYHWANFNDSIDKNHSSDVGGGDMASYLRNVYGSKIDSNSILAMAEVYDTPDPAQASGYVTKLQATVSALISATLALTSTDSNGNSVSSAASGTNNNSSTGNTSSSSSGIVVSTTGSDGCSSSTYNCPSTSSGVSGKADLSSVRQAVVCIAQGELAMWKNQPGYPWNSTRNNTYSEKEPLGRYIPSGRALELWCADFSSWVYNQAGDPITGSTTSWNIAGVAGIAGIGQRNEKFKWHPSGSGYTPQPGDLTIYNFGKGYDHVDIVVSVSGSNVTTIGGDTGPSAYAPHGTDFPDPPGSPSGSVVSQSTKYGFYSGGAIGYVSPD